LEIMPVGNRQAGTPAATLATLTTWDFQLRARDAPSAE
jgi:hypothetical protein